MVRSLVKFAVGIVVGVLLYLGVSALRSESWIDSIPRECADQGLHTKITVGEGRIQAWECVAP